MAEADESDRRWMRAALAYGRRGFGTTAPNPCVSALVIRDGVVVGRGITAPGGRPHAEPLALAQAGEAARGATLVVTLEPCCHASPRGRPCTEPILESGVARVVVGCGDPDPRMAGQGIARLRAAGIAVTAGVCAPEAARDHIGHIRRVRDGRPMVTLKLAETADGLAAAAPGDPRLMITGAVANGWVHIARSLHDAVLVGAGTARADDPLLTVRLPGLAGASRLRVVFDPMATLPPAGRLAASAAAVPLLVVAGSGADPARVAALRARGVEVETVATGPGGGLALHAAQARLAARGLTRLFCEGGPHLAAALLDGDLVDELALLTGPEPAGRPGRPALNAASRRLLGDPARFRLVEDRPLGPDRLRRFERIAPCSPD